MKGRQEPLAKARSIRLYNLPATIWCPTDGAGDMA
jgi:hypothetical protein